VKFDIGIPLKSRIQLAVPIADTVLPVTIDSNPKAKLPSTATLDLNSDLLGLASDFTVSDAFAINLSANAPHVTLIACESGSQDNAPGNEPLGFIPAWLYAGATSVLGTLWSVDSRIARFFSEALYEDIARQQGMQKNNEDSVCIIKLAFALRPAVKNMISKKDQYIDRPLQWALYILYGSWFHVLERRLSSL
jgi:CHAT domain-containing protein